MTAITAPVPPQELGELVPFLDCSEGQLRDVQELGRHQHLRAGDVLLSAGELTRQVIVVVSGAVRVRDDRGLDAVLVRGDVVGEMAALGGEPHSADVTAETPAEVLIYRDEDLDRLVEIEPVADRLRAIARARVMAPAATVIEARHVPVLEPRPKLRGVGAGIYGADVPARPVRTITVLTIGIVATAAAGWVVLQRNVATPVSLDDVLADARSTATATPQLPPRPARDVPVPATAAPAPADLAASGAITTPAADATTTDTVTATRPADADPTAVPATQTGSDTAPDAAPVRFTMPAPGVYSYATTGGDRINIAGAHHDYPETTHAILRHTGNCGWSAEHRVLEEHVDYHDRCTEPAVVSVVADGREVEFFGQSDGLMYVCDPPAPTMWDTPPGTTSTGTCATESGDSETHYEGVYVGPATLRVGGEDVLTEHVHVEFTMTGSSRGTSTVDFWLHHETGLIVREERVVDTYADAVWGSIRYQEEATFHVLSLTPRT